MTTLGRLQPGTRVNLEVDQMARYAERLLSRRTLNAKQSNVSCRKFRFREAGALR